MRGSYQWAMLRLAVLAAFVIPATFVKPDQPHINASGSWLAAVDIAAPVLALHEPDLPLPTLSAGVVAEIKQSAVLATQAQQEAMQALRKELAREIARARAQRAESAQGHAKG